MTEEQLNALKGLLHYLNGPRKDKSATRGFTPKTSEDRLHGGLKFVTDVFDEDGNLVGSIKGGSTSNYRLFLGKLG